MAKRHSSRHTHLVAAFAASAFALLAIATAQYETAEKQVAQITGRPSVETNEYQYKRLFTCGKHYAGSQAHERAGRQCEKLLKRVDGRR